MKNMDMCSRDIQLHGRGLIPSAEGGHLEEGLAAYYMGSFKVRETIYMGFLFQKSQRIPHIHLYSVVGSWASPQVLLRA